MSRYCAERHTVGLPERVHGVGRLALAQRLLHEPQDGAVAARRRQLQRRLVELGGGARVRAVPQQHAGRRRVPALRRPVQRRHAQHVPAGERASAGPVRRRAPAGSGGPGVTCSPRARPAPAAAPRRRRGPRAPPGAAACAPPWCASRATRRRAAARRTCPRARRPPPRAAGTCPAAGETASVRET